MLNEELNDEELHEEEEELAVSLSVDTPRSSASPAFFPCSALLRARSYAGEMAQAELAKVRFQLEQIEATLEIDPGNAELSALADTMREVQRREEAGRDVGGDVGGARRGERHVCGVGSDAWARMEHGDVALTSIATWLGHVSLFVSPSLLPAFFYPCVFQSCVVQRRP